MWSEPQIDQVLDSVEVLSGKNPYSQHFMKPQKPFSFPRKTDNHHHCVAIFLKMNSIPDQLKNILNNEFARVIAGLMLGSNLAKGFLFYEKGIIPIESENVMRKKNSWTDKLDFVHLPSYSIFCKRERTTFSARKLTKSETCHVVTCGAMPQLFKRRPVSEITH